MLGRKRCGLLILVFVLVGLEAWAGAKFTGPDALGSLTVRSSVWVNGQAAVSGTTVYPGDVVETGRDAAAALTFKSGAVADLLGGTEIALPLEASSTVVNLRRGAMQMRGSRQGWTRVSVLGTSVYMRGEGQFPALCRIAAVGRGAAAINESGRVEIFGAGAPFLLPKGKMVKWEAGAPQGGAQQAGKVAAAIPAETVQRQGQTQPLPLKMQDAVNWEDTVRTERTGRVRIELLDGSSLNIGARSVFRVIKHDPQTQQTVVEMTLGKMRGEVVKLTKPGASFQVRTQTAVIGVVGTIFLIHAAANFTRVHCIQGLVTVSNINPAIGGAVSLGAGQMTTVPRGFAPGGVAGSPAGQVNSAMNQTNVGGPAGGPGGAGAAGGGGAGAPPTGAVTGAANTAASTASTAANATSAGLAGGAVSVVGTATTTLNSTTTSLDSTATSLDSTTTTLNTATTSSTDATQAANTAAAASNNLDTGTQTVIQAVVSPSAPCGCQ